MGKPWFDSAGYLINRVPGHPLARGDNKVKVHRMVLFDALCSEMECSAEELLARDMTCRWCRWPVSWAITYRPGGTEDERWSALVVDHLGARDDNDRASLVVSCPWCNSQRSLDRELVESGKMCGTKPWERPMLNQRADVPTPVKREADSEADAEPTEDGHPGISWRDRWEHHRRAFRWPVIFGLLVVALIYGRALVPWPYMIVVGVPLCILWARGPQSRRMSYEDMPDVALVTWQEMLARVIEVQPQPVAKSAVVERVSVERAPSERPLASWMLDEDEEDEDDDTF